MNGVCIRKHALISLLLSLITANALAESAKNVEDTQKEETSILSSITIEDIRAEGLRPETVEAGSFRGTNIMDVPSTVNVITKEALDLQAATGTYDAVRNTAGVTKQQNGGETWDQLVIRGIEVQNRTNYRLNGSLPLMKL